MYNIDKNENQQKDLHPAQNFDYSTLTYYNVDYID